MCYALHMDTNLTGFSTTQQRALFDLLILAMYADGHLTSVEDVQLKEMLMAMGFAEEPDRQREFDAALGRMQPFVQSVWKAKGQAILLADAFTDRKQRKQVFAGVEQIMTADNHVSVWENTLLMELRLKYRL